MTKSSLSLFCFILLPGLALSLLAPIRASAQSVNDGFDPDASGDVYAVAVQPDGSRDRDFASTPVDAEIYAIAVQADGRIVASESFARSARSFAIASRGSMTTAAWTPRSTGCERLVMALARTGRWPHQRITIASNCTLQNKLEMKHRVTSFCRQ